MTPMTAQAGTLRNQSDRRVAVDPGVLLAPGAELDVTELGPLADRGIAAGRLEFTPARKPRKPRPDPVEAATTPAGDTPAAPTTPED